MPRGRESDSGYGVKLIRTFAELLFTGRSKSMTELADMLKCSKPTVRRIVDDISRSYIPIQEEKIGKQLFFKIPKPRPSDIPPLSTNELAVMEMCQAFTRHLLGKKQFEEAARGLQKSQGLLTSGEAGTSGREFGCFTLGSIDYTPHQEVLQHLIEAISKRLVCRVTYQALGVDKPRTYHVTPLKIFAHKDTVYVHARRSTPTGEALTDDDFYPLLAVHRFKKVQVLEATYEFPKDYNFEELFNQTFGVMKDKSFRVKVRFTGWAAKFVAERVWSADQKIKHNEDGSIVLEFTATSESEVLGWMLSFGAEATLLSSGRLLKKLMKELQCMLGAYVFHTKCRHNPSPIGSNTIQQTF